MGQRRVSTVVLKRLEERHAVRHDERPRLSTLYVLEEVVRVCLLCFGPLESAPVA